MDAASLSCKSPNAEEMASSLEASAVSSLSSLRVGTDFSVDLLSFSTLFSSDSSSFPCKSSSAVNCSVSEKCSLIFAVIRGAFATPDAFLNLKCYYQHLVMCASLSLTGIQLSGRKATSALVKNKARQSWDQL